MKSEILSAIRSNILTLHSVLQIITGKQDWSSGFNRIALAFMSNARRLFTWSLLTVYLSVSLFGELVHLAQCASCAADAVVNSACVTCSCHGHSRHSAHRSVAPLTSAESLCRSTEDAAEGKDSIPSHDSESCAVCKVLAIAKAQACELVAVTCVDRLPEALIPVQESVACIEFRDAPSRGPPLA